MYLVFSMYLYRQKEKENVTNLGISLPLSVLKRTVAHCNTLLHTATQCYTLHCSMGVCVFKMHALAYLQIINASLNTFLGLFCEMRDILNTYRERGREKDVPGDCRVL